MRRRHTTEGKFPAPYQYRRASARKRLNLALTVSRNLPAIIPIYVCLLHRRWENLVGRRQELEMRRLIAEFFSDESGATAIEYCLIAVGISIVILVAVNGIGTTLSDKFVSINASIK
jgi:pilus assembly protein Flp/PilA